MGIFTLPSLGSDMEAGTLVEWLVAPGDKVHRGDVVAVIETQKGAVEIECFQDGTVEALLVETGENLPVGAPLAQIRAKNECAAQVSHKPSADSKMTTTSETSGAIEPVAARKPPTVTSSAEVVAASPAARRRARELNVNLAEIEGSFPGGNIVLADVEAAVLGEATHRSDKPLSASENMRQAIGAAMTQAKRTIPHFYLSQQIDIQPAMSWLAVHNERVSPAERILIGAMFVRAAVHAAKSVGTMNGHFTNGRFLPADGVNVGVAVALRGGGLVAPALIGADDMTLVETMQGMRDLVSRARSGRLRNSEMTKGTITVSSLGEGGAEAMTGVIFPPQVALVCLGTPQVRPWVVSDEIIPRQVVTLTLSVDHRVSDGRQATQFISSFSEVISDPETL